MNNNAKNIKNIIKFTILTLFFTTACIPTAFDGLPELILASAGPTASPNPRAEVCNLLLKVGRTQADVQTCLTAESISNADKDLLCALSSGLTEAEKEILRAELIKLGVDTSSCGSSIPGNGEPDPENPAPKSPGGIPPEVDNPEPDETPVFATPAPTATPSSGTAGGGTGGAFGGGSSSGGNPDAGVVVEVTDVPPEEIGAGGG